MPKAVAAKEGRQFIVRKVKAHDFPKLQKFGEKTLTAASRAADVCTYTHAPSHNGRKAFDIMNDQTFACLPLSLSNSTWFRVSRDSSFTILQAMQMSTRTLLSFMLLLLLDASWISFSGH